MNSIITVPILLGSLVMKDSIGTVLLDLGYVAPYSPLGAQVSMVRTNPRYGHMQSSPLVLAYSRPHLTAAANLPFELSRSPLNNLISLPMRHRYERRIGSIQGTPWVAPRQLQPVRYGYQGEAGLASNPVRWDRANSLASSTRIRTMSNLYPNSINSPRRSSAVLRTRTRVPEHYWSPRRRTMTNLNSNLIGSPGQTIRGSSVVLRTLAPEHYWTRGLPIPGRGRASGQTTSRRQARIFSEPLPGEAQIELIGPTKIEVEDVPIALRLLMADALAARGRSAESLRLGTVREAAPQPIIGGTDAEKYKYPWHVQVYWVLYSGGAYMCGGTIIDSRTVLTAGHCATDVGQRNGFYGMVAGDHDRRVNEGPEQVAYAAEVRLHPQYRGYSGAYVVRNDIALLITDRQWNFTTAVQPVPRLSEDGDTDEMAIESGNCVAIGYGIYKQDPSVKTADILQVVPINWIDNDQCHNIMWPPLDLSVTPRMVCSLEPNSGVCNGDSGGSNGCYDSAGNFYHVGITSWVIKENGRCGRNWPSVYTRVSAFRNWIRDFRFGGRGGPRNEPNDIIGRRS